MNVFPLPSALLGTRLRVALVGVGGSGSPMLENIIKLSLLLEEMGMDMSISIFDDDVVSSASVGRTKFAYADIGISKVDILASRYSMFFGVDIDANPRKFDVSRDTGEFDLIVSCTDSAKFRVELGQLSGSMFDDYVSDTLWLDMGNDEKSGQIILGHLFNKVHSSVLRLPNVYDLYGKELEDKASNEVERDSCTLLEATASQSIAINSSVATAALALLNELFVGGSIGVHGAFIDIEKQVTKPVPIDQRVWDFISSK